MRLLTYIRYIDIDLIKRQKYTCTAFKSFIQLVFSSLALSFFIFSTFTYFIISALLLQCQVSGEACGQEELSNCAKPLEVLSSTSELSFVTKREDLDKLCP